MRTRPFVKITRTQLILSFLALIVGCIIVFISILVLKKPNNDRNWDSQFAVSTVITQEGSDYTFTNIRDWSYSPGQVLKQNYTTRTYNPQQITQVWFLVEPFGVWDGVAHTYFTFDFVDAPSLSFSIEARREDGENYSGFTGLLDEYELAYMWGTETDFLVRRAVHLDNQVYMYPLQIADSWKINLFEELVKQTQDLQQNPRFYNTLTTNCTNSLVDIVNYVRPGTVPWHPARVITGYADEYLYDLGYIPNDQPFRNVQENHKVNDIVRKYYQSPDLSSILREELAKEKI